MASIAPKVADSQLSDFTKLASDLTDSPLRLVLIVNHLVGLVYNLSTRNKDISLTYYSSITDQTNGLLETLKN